MILVVLGNHPQSFCRLLEKIDELIEHNIIKNVFAQIGYSDYTPKNYKYKKFVGFNTFLKLISESRFVISHAGAGTIINILSYNKPAVIVPRLKQFGEHTNDHQLEITHALEKKGEIIPVYEIDNLGQAIEKANNFNTKKMNVASGINNLIQNKMELWFQQ